MINSIDIILISIIKIIIFINNIITKISLIYETEKELKYYKNENNNFKVMLKYSYEELQEERRKRIETDNKILDLRQLYLKKLLEDDKEETITKLENIKDTYHKKIDELHKTILINKNDYRNKLIKLEKIIKIKTHKYYDLEIEYKKHLDDYFNLKLLVDNQVNLNKRLRFKLKDAYSSIRSLRNERNKIIKYYKNQEI